MADKDIAKLEREYTIPLREKCRPVPRYKKTPKAVKTVKEFLARHMGVRDRDLKKIKIDKYLNEQLWVRGIKKPLHKVKVRAVKEGDIVRVYAVDLPKKLAFKKTREEKQVIKSKEAHEMKKESKKSMMEKAKESLQPGKEDKAPKEGVSQGGTSSSTSPSKEAKEGKEEAKSGVPEETAKAEAKLGVKKSKKEEAPKEEKKEDSKKETKEMQK